MSVAGLVVQYLRKALADDRLDMLNVSSGLSAAASGLWILQCRRGRADAVLYVVHLQVPRSLEPLPAGQTVALVGVRTLLSARRKDMSKSTKDILRELETSGILEGKPAALPATRPEKPPKRGRGTAGSSGLVFLVVAAVLAAAIGSLPFGSLALYPFSLFVTLIHETGHALAATLTGGSVVSLQINADLSGLVQTSGGIEAVIAPAGYLGATLAGVGLLLAPLRYARWALGALAVIPFIDLLLFHPYNWFTTIWAVIFLAALGVAAWKLPQRFAAFLQIFLGVQVGLNAFRDLMTLFFISGTNSHIHTDAANMSHALFLPPIFWSLLWTVLSVVLLLAALVKVARRDLPGLRRPRASAL